MSASRHLGTRLTAAEAAARLLDDAASSATVRRQVLDANQVQKLALTLGRPVLGGIDMSSRPPPPGTPIPPGHHVVYFTPGSTEAQLGADGSDRGFNAPHPFMRRMWAGGRMAWSGALRVGDEVEEHTRLVGATAKSSRSAGEMVLVEVDKELRDPRGGVVVDRRSRVFRPEAGAPESAGPAITPPGSSADPPSASSASRHSPSTATRSITATRGAGPSRAIPASLSTGRSTSSASSTTGATSTAPTASRPASTTAPWRPCMPARRTRSAPKRRWGTR